tara:strand:- start:2180 stop:2749 length:570 start_codon:yes stop_codon:yes gene_type:complete
MKTFLRVDTTDDDAVISSYVSAATEAIKQYLRVALLTETFVFKADGFEYSDADDRLLALGAGTHTGCRPYLLGGGQTLDVPFPPLQSVTNIVTYNRGNTSSTFAASNYQLDLQSGRIYLNDGSSWPSELRAQDAVEVTYVAGYGSGSIPQPILQAIRMYVEQLYDGCDGMTAEVRRLLAPYRRADELAW